MELSEEIRLWSKRNSNICPRCGRAFDGRSDKSIQLPDVKICSSCGLDEAIKEYNCESFLLANWYAVSNK